MNTKPLKLPKFTFLCSGKPQYEFAKLLLDQDSEMLLCDLEEPLRLAAQALFYGGFDFAIDLTKPEERLKKILPGCRSTFQDLIHRLEDVLVHEETNTILGQIALKNLHEDGHETVFQRFLYRDCHSLYNVLPFIDKYGSDEVLCIHFNFLPPMKSIQCRHIWLPNPDLKLQLEALARELKCPIASFPSLGPLAATATPASSLKKPENPTAP